MAGFKIELFGGIRPRISARKLKPGEAQTAQNSKLGSGDLEPWDSPDSGTAVSNTWYNKTIYRFDNDGTPRWFEWVQYVDVARGPVKDDSLERTYYTGDGVPKMTYTTIADAGGGGPYPEDYRDLGIPEPPNALEVESEAPAEDVASEDRIITALRCAAFIIDYVNFSVYPGTGTDDEIWDTVAGNLGWVAFDYGPGDQFRVKRVESDVTAVLESAEFPGMFARTPTADSTDLWSAKEMSETGSTKVADWIGWRIPEAVATFAVAHRLQVGDVITITTVPFSSFKGQLSYNPLVTVLHYEQSWETPTQVTEDNVTFYQVANARVSASATEGSSLFAFGGTFQQWGYKVDRAASEVNVFEDRQYVYTYVSDLGEEGPPSPVSSIVKVLDGKSVDITGFENVWTHGDLTKRVIDFYRIYRTSSTQAGTEFQFIKEVGVGTSQALSTHSNTVTDTTRQADLGEILSTGTWFKPPTGMQGITTMPNGMMVGFKGKNVYFCEPYFPHAWPAEYDQAVDYDIVGLAAFGNAVAILTKGHPYIITGAHPRNANVRPYKLNQACLNKESIATNNDKVYYASPDGLIELGINGTRIITDAYTLKKEWQAYSPDSMIGEFHDGKYFGFWGTEAAAANPQADATVVISGTFKSTTVEEDDIQAGGKTIILTVTDNTWEAAGAAFNAIRQAIIDSFVSQQSETNGWNSLTIPVTDVVRTSATVVTITLTAQAAYEIDAAEVLDVTLPVTVFATTPSAVIFIDDTLDIAASLDYSSKAMFVSSTGKVAVSQGDNDSFVVSSFASNVTSLTMPTQTIAQCISYDSVRGRWVIGARDDDGSTNIQRLWTSDDDGLRWVRRSAINPITALPVEQMAYYPEKDLHVIAYGDTSGVQPAGQFSQDNADNWDWLPYWGSFLNTAWEHSLGDFAFLNGDLWTISNGLTGLTAPGVLTHDANNPGQGATIKILTWTSLSAGVGDDWAQSMCAGNGKFLSIALNASSNIEINEYIQLSGADNAIGAISGAVAHATIRYGDDLFMICSDDFEITTVASGSEGTIGNWSSLSSSKVANIKIYNLYYNPGDGGASPGWGWVAVGQNTSSSKGVVYTSSDDGATWTLRYTSSDNSIIKSAAFEHQLSDQEKS